MIRTRHQQPTLWTGFLHEEVSDLWEPWMRQADHLLEDETLIEHVFQAQGRRWKKSRTRGRLQTPAEVVLRLLILKHVRDWSYQTLEREVRANLVYRSFARIGSEKVPDAKTLGRLGQVVGGNVVAQLHQRLVEIAVEKKIVPGCKMRVDTTVVETNIHYPTDSSLLGDGARVLTRVMKRVEAAAGGLARKVRNRMRTVRQKVVAIAMASRQAGAAGEEKRRSLYKGLLSVTRKIVNQAQRVAGEVERWGRQRQKRVSGLKTQLTTMIGRVQQVIQQTRVRVLHGETQYSDKIVSVFEPQTEIIRKGKASKPTEFGKLVKIQEAENQIVTHYEVYDERPSDASLLVDAVEKHREQTGRVPHAVTADSGFYTQANEKQLEASGVKRISIPNRKTRSPERRAYQKQRWFKKGQRWRTGCEGRISILKRRHGLNRCLYRGQEGMRRWVGLGVIADNLINMGLRLTMKTQARMMG
jgi:transposase, IS5 family